MPPVCLLAALLFITKIKATMANTTRRRPKPAPTPTPMYVPPKGRMLVREDVRLFRNTGLAALGCNAFDLKSLLQEV